MKKLVEHIQIYITHVRQNKWVKGRVQIIDGTLNLIIRWSNFPMTRKGKVKVAKITYFTLLNTKEPIYHRPYQGNTDSTILRLFGKCHTGKY
nr:hypothetical protein [Mycoplasmopsis bovis]